MFIKVILGNVLAFLFVIQSLVAKNQSQALSYQTATPVKYLVVIYAENSTFDHFFATYPYALNLPGEPFFKAKRNTPDVNGLSGGLLTHNPNSLNPFRLPRTVATKEEPNQSYTILQQDAFSGLMDQFVQNNSDFPQVMSYYDGNTVTALWNYAQRFAMSDNFFCTNFEPSAPGHINLISGQTHGALPPNFIFEGFIDTIDGTIINDAYPAFDKCSTPERVEMTGKNVGDLLNKQNITWGWFSAGFRDCSQSHIGNNGELITDYIPVFEPFQYYRSTSNPEHLPPSSVKMIGFQDQANHQYDLEDFWEAAAIHNIPAVSFFKPPGYQTGHPGFSSPLALQTFLVKTINRLQRLPEWKHMAILIAWDDAGGWYDHVMPPIVNQSHTPVDALLGPGNAGNPPPGAYQARLAYGLRLPFLVISPFAKRNFVDHTLQDQTSILRFIEDNWFLGRIGDQSFDQIAGSLLNLFDFKSPHYSPLLLHTDTGLKKKKNK